MISRPNLALLALCAGSAIHAQQWTTNDDSRRTAPDRSASSDYGHFGGPVGALSAVGSDGFTTFGHPLFPAYSARIKETKWCDPTVKAYTGYIDIAVRTCSS